MVVTIGIFIPASRPLNDHACEAAFLLFSVHQYAERINALQVGEMRRGTDGVGALEQVLGLLANLHSLTNARLDSN